MTTVIMDTNAHINGVGVLAGQHKLAKTQLAVVPSEYGLRTEY